MLDTLGAFVPEGALDRKEIEIGPLSGLTFAVKDLFAVKGVRATCGNPDWARTHAPATEDAPPVRACLDAGAHLLGRTVMDELAYSLSGRNPHFGTPTNTNAPGRLTGGSSCGSAAAVAGGMVDFALGTDTGGSIRVPASYCGLFGLRPTHGAISLDGAMALAPSFDTVGWFTREAELLRAVGDVLLPPAPDGAPAEPASLVVAEDAWALATPDAQTALRPWVDRLQYRLGQAKTVSLDEKGEGLGAWMDCFRRIQAREAHAEFADWIARERPVFGPEMQERWDFVHSITAEAAEAAAETRRRYRARMTELTREGAVICLPCAAGPAPRLDATAEALADHRGRTLQVTAPAGLAGLPQIALPVATVEGVPLGLGLIGPKGSDRMLLDFAVALCGETQHDPGARFD
jgi:amidase